MLIESGDRRYRWLSVTDAPWTLFEFLSDSNARQVLKSVAKSMSLFPATWRAQVFVPINSETILMPCLFARCSHAEGLRKICTVRGLELIGRHAVQNAEVQKLISEDRERSIAHAAEIQVGVHVRITDGEARGYAGIVQKRWRYRCQVLIKGQPEIVVRTYAGNLSKMEASQ